MLTPATKTRWVDLIAPARDRLTGDEPLTAAEREGLADLLAQLVVLFDEAAGCGEPATSITTRADVEFRAAQVLGQLAAAREVAAR